jgi:hypothetical protein
MMVNFAEHIHDIDPVTYRRRICGCDEIDLPVNQTTEEDKNGPKQR